MDIADLIVEEINRQGDGLLEGIRSRYRARNKLNRQDYSTLVRLLEDDPIAVLQAEDMNGREVDLIGKTLVKSKIKDIDRLISYLIEEDSKRTPVLLHSLLYKRCRINTSGVAEYIHRIIARETLLCHLKVLLVVSRNYPQLITPAIVEFCRKNGHAVCAEILKRHTVEAA